MNIMKLLITGCLLLAVIAAFPASATTEKNLPTQAEVTSFISSAETASASEMMTKFIEKIPTGYCDLWKTADGDLLSIYYKADTPKGYGAVYINDAGNTVSVPCSDASLIKSYVGVAASSPAEEVKEEEITVPEETTNEAVTTKDTNHKLADLVSVLGEYKGKTNCQSMGCATDLRNWLDEKGWTAEVMTKTFKTINGETRYCIEVNTSDEGAQDIILG